MRGSFAAACILARKHAGLTQEEAAYQLNIATRTLAYYETGRIPPDDIVAHMVQIYQSPALGYAYLSSESAVGRILLPQIKVMGISSGALQLHVSMRKAAGLADMLDEICADNQISREEERSFRDCLDTFDRLMASIIGIKIAGSGDALAGVR